jgi:O-methyltransferase involved in polyketide biosynthesis
MTDQIHVELGGVQKTLFLPLWGRAAESKKNRPMLKDETAVRIIDQVDFDFAPLARNLDELTQIAWIKRSLTCDQVIRKFLAAHPEGTIVNIGCGLDTTFERIDNGRLRWYDLDLPDVIGLRRKFIEESDRRQFIAASFLDGGWMESIQCAANVLFIAAGVFYYFEGPQIRELTLRILHAFPGSELLFDASSPTGVKIANKKVVESSGLDERSYLKWGLDNKKEILAWDPGIRILATYYYFRTFRMSPRNIVMGVLSDSLGIQYMLHLQLGRPK